MTLLYPRHSPPDLEPHYSRHVSAMTTEGLHHKSAIAVQLAARDKEIDRLRDELGSAQMALVEYGEWKAVWDKERDRLRSDLAAVNTHRRAAERAKARIVELEQAVKWLRGRVSVLEE